MTPDANDLCVFAIKRGSIEGRIDTFYNQPKYAQVLSELSSRTSLTAFGSIIESISGGATPLRANEDQYSSSGIKFLRIQNITPRGFDFSDVKFITENVHNGLLKRSQLASGDLLFTITGRIGTSAVVTESCLPANINQHIVRIRLKSGVDPYYLAAFLNSNIGRLLSNRGVTGTTRIALDYESIKRIPIPAIDDKELQAELVQLERNAINQFNGRIIDSNKLLSGTASFMLTKLGLSFDTSANMISYHAHLSDIDGRIDADYYSPRFVSFRKQIEQSSYPNASIAQISEKIVSGFAAGKQDQADDLPSDQRVPHLRPFSITPEGELSFDTQKYVPKSRLKPEDYCRKNEVIFNNTNSPDLVGKTTVFDSDVLCAASNHMTRITVKEGVNPYYIAAFFNVLLSIGYWKLLCTNFNNQAGVNTDTLKRVKIPLPPKEMQDQIAVELMQRRSQANTLRKQAIEEWAEAKAQFEKELLGEK